MNMTQDDITWASAFAATIRAESAKLGLRDTDMVKATGIPSTTYWQIQREGGRSPNPIQIRKIARALGLTVADLFDRADELAAEMPARKTNAQKAIEHYDRTHPTSVDEQDDGVNSRAEA